jgi:hypothetical protein
MYTLFVVFPLFCLVPVYFHMYEWLKIVFGLVTELIDQFNTTCNYILQFIVTHTHTSVLSQLQSPIVVAG